MPVSSLSTTTLSQAVDSSRNDFWVASTTNIKVGDYLVCRAEAMKVREVLDSTHVTVVRGVGGTLARAHPNGQRFFIGSPEKFQAIKESATALFGDSGTYPEFMLPGQRATDAAGNEFVLLGPPLIQLYTGQTVIISRDGLYTMSIAYLNTHGSVAVLVEPIGTSQFGWGQIYGYNSYCQDGSKTSAATSAYAPCAQTSVTTPVAGMAAIAAASLSGEYLIHGMFIVGAATTATTLATSSTGVAVPVWLNYPYTRDFSVSLATSGP